MILKNQVEWALHCCAILSALPDGKYLATKDLAEFHGVPKEYLSKALQGLSQAGLLVSTLGPSGGYRLAKPAHEITFLDVVEAVEGKSSTFACTEIRQNNPCRPKNYCESKICGIARVMWEADEAWRDTLRKVSMEDLQRMLAEGIPPDLLQKSFAWILSRT